MTTNENADQEQAKRWTLTVDEEGVLNIPDEVLDALGWEVMDELEWIDQKDGSFLLVKATENSAPEYTSTIEKMTLLNRSFNLNDLIKEKSRLKKRDALAEVIASTALFSFCVIAFKYAFDATWGQSFFVSWVIHIVRDALQAIAERVK